MSVSAGWSDQIERTWLGKKNSRRRADERVRQLLAGHRGDRSRESWATAVALDLETAHESITQLGLHGQWLACTAMIVLTGELVLCAPHGGVLGDEALASLRRETRVHAEALRLLRNAVCHPAHHLDGGSGPPPIARLVAHIQVSDPEQKALAEDLQRAWSVLGERRVTEFALRKLDVTGRTICTRWGIRVKG